MGKHQNGHKKGINKYFIFVISVVCIIGIIFFIWSFLVKDNSRHEKSLAEPDFSQEISNVSSDQTRGTTQEVTAETPSETTSEPSLESTTTKESEKDELYSAAQPLLKEATNVSYGVYYFQHQDFLSNENNQPMIAASIIKVFILEYLYEKIKNSELTEATQINGLTLVQLAQQMIQTSDNEATNVLIDYFGMENLNQYFIKAGYQQTLLQRKMLDTQAQEMGLENYTSLTDTMSFLKKMYHNQNDYPYNEMFQIMTGQQIGTKIRLKLPNYIIANKTGELPGVENDIGIVMSADPFAIVILSNGVTNSEMMRQSIANFALAASQN